MSSDKRMFNKVKKLRISLKEKKTCDLVHRRKVDCIEKDCWWGKFS